MGAVIKRWQDKTSQIFRQQRKNTQDELLSQIDRLLNAQEGTAHIFWRQKRNRNSNFRPIFERKTNEYVASHLCTPANERSVYFLNRRWIMNESFKNIHFWNCQKYESSPKIIKWLLRDSFPLIQASHLKEQQKLSLETPFFSFIKLTYNIWRIIQCSAFYISQTEKESFMNIVHTSFGETILGLISNNWFPIFGDLNNHFNESFILIIKFNAFLINQQNIKKKSFSIFGDVAKHFNDSFVFRTNFEQLIFNICWFLQ